MECGIGAQKRDDVAPRHRSLARFPNDVRGRGRGKDSGFGWSPVSPPFTPESSLKFSAGGLHVGEVHDLLELGQHCRFCLRQEVDNRSGRSSVTLLQLYALIVSNQGALL